MWRNSECGNPEKPSSVQIDENCNIVWVRRNFVEINEPAKDGREARQGWSYEENKIPLEDWETYQQVMKHEDSISDVETAVIETAEVVMTNETALSDLESAIMELAEMINGGAE